MGSPLIVLTASNTEAGEWRHSIWQQMLSATIPSKLSKTFINQAALRNESWPDGRDVVTCYAEHLEKFVGPETKVGRSFPLAHIRASAEVNAREGAAEGMLASEDMFLYEQFPNFTPNVPALVELFRGVKTVRGLDMIDAVPVRFTREAEPAQAPACGD